MSSLAGLDQTGAFEVGSSSEFCGVCADSLGGAGRGVGCSVADTDGMGA